MMTSIERAVQAMGSQSALARATNVRPQAVQQWVAAGRVSHTKVLDVERVSGVPRHELRPDLYPPEKASASA